MTSDARPLTFSVSEAHDVSGLLQAPEEAHALYVLAHGAGAGMTHAFMAAFAGLLAERGIATLRYQFPYMERGSRRPDQPALAEATVAAAVAEAQRLKPRLPLFAGGKSFGGRMTSQAQANGLIEPVRGLAFAGFPLHPPGRPSDVRAAHLADVSVPMLFLQGSRDEFATPDLLHPVVQRLGDLASLHLVDQADHGFRVPARTGRKADDVMVELADVLAAWVLRVIAA